MNAIRVGSLVLEPQVAAHAAEMFASLSRAPFLVARVTRLAAVRAMLEELAERYCVRAVSATVRARNCRSLAFLRSLEFGADPPCGVSAARHEPDEVVMYKSLREANNALPT